MQTTHAKLTYVLEIIAKSTADTLSGVHTIKLLQTN